VVLLELDTDLLIQGAKETGYSCLVQDSPRQTIMELSALEREGPLLLFDAADPANTGWFSRCQFYVDARTGGVLQTPFIVGHRYDSNGRPHPRMVNVQIRKELPAHFRLPGRQAINEKSLYSVLFGFLNALQTTGVGLCGSGLIRPLAGRIDTPTR